MLMPMVMTSMVSGRHAEPVNEPADPVIPARATRRTYGAQYQLRILAKYERRDRDGQGGGDGARPTSSSDALRCASSTELAFSRRLLLHTPNASPANCRFRHRCRDQPGLTTRGDLTRLKRPCRGRTMLDGACLAAQFESNQ
jgi:hypothetical protein